jgi:hypothetical protein
LLVKLLSQELLIPELEPAVSHSAFCALLVGIEILEVVDPPSASTPPELATLLLTVPLQELVSGDAVPAVSQVCV